MAVQPRGVWSAVELLLLLGCISADVLAGKQSIIHTDFCLDLKDSLARWRFLKNANTFKSVICAQYCALMALGLCDWPLVEKFMHHNYLLQLLLYMYNNTGGTGGKFTTGGLLNRCCTLTCEYLANFRKIRNDPNFIFMGLGEDDSWKRSEAKNLVTLSL
jgi:hypothetical protein